MTPGNFAPTLRVLLVDDCPDTLRSMSTLLRLWGHETCLAKDGPAALTAAADFRPDVVMLDIGLPGMNGWEVARRLRQMSGGDRLVLVAVSGFAREQDVAASRAAGCNQHLVKPIDLDDFRHFLATLCREGVGAVGE